MLRDKTSFFHNASTWVFIFFLIVFIIATKRSVSSWNDASRMATIQALVEERTFKIDNTIFVDLTSDTYAYKGHVYSDKPPALAIMGSVVYGITSRVGITFETAPSLAYYLINFFTIGFFSALGMVYFWKILVEFFKTSAIWATITTLVAGTGTLFFPFSTVFNSHTIVGSFLIIGYYFCLTFITRERMVYLFIAGIFFSLGASIDPAGMIFIPFAIIMIARHSIKKASIFAMLIVPIVAGSLAVNMNLSGSLLPPTLNASIHEYIDSPLTRENMAGLATHDDFSDLVIYAFHSLLGNRGLFSHSPILLFSLIGFFALHRNQNRFWFYKDYVILLLGCLTYIALYLLRTNNYSGDSFGVRWFASITPILMLPFSVLEDNIRSKRTYQIGFWVLSLISILLAVLGSYRPFLPTSEAIPGEPQIVDNTIIVAFDRFIGQASQIGRLRTILVGVLICAILGMTMWHFYREQNVGEASPN